MLLWFAVARSPYNDFLFSELARTFRLRVVYLHKGPGAHPWELAAPAYETLFLEDGWWPVLGSLRMAKGIVFSGWHDWRYLLLMRFLPASVPKAFWTDSPDMAPRAGLKQRVRMGVIRDVFRRFDQVWSTGRMGCDALRALGCPEVKIRSFPFFYDLTRFERVTSEQRAAAAELRRSHGAEAGATVFLVAGQLIAKKRFDDAIRAIARLKTPGAWLWIAGTGAQEAELRSLAAELGVAEQVVFLGWLQPAQVEIAFLAVDVFVHPASRDPFPTVVLDAMTWGKPIIGTDVSGSVVDRVRPGENGFIFAEGDVPALAVHMRAFTSAPERVAAFGAAARATACEHPVSRGIDTVQALMGGAR